MKNANWKDVAELIGIAAIVASLIFVGLQMRQSQEIAMAEQYQARAVIAIEGWHKRKENEFDVRRIGGQEISLHGAPPHLGENATPEQIGSEFLDVRMTFLTYDNIHFQYSSGFLTDEAWAANVRGMSATLKQPQFSALLVRAQGIFPKRPTGTGGISWSGNPSNPDDRSRIDRLVSWISW